MSNHALDLLIECELLRSNGKPIDLKGLSESELSRRYSAYVSSRRSTLPGEINSYDRNQKLSAQYSTWSAKPTREKILSSLLIYNKLTIDDPLISSDDQISMSALEEGVAFLSWLYPLIRAGFVSIFPITFYNTPSNLIPIWHSEDAFRSAIPEDLHDFAHRNAILKSVVQSEDGAMLVLHEDASIKRRTALHVGFQDDNLYSGVSLYIFQTIEKMKKNQDGTFSIQQRWKKNGTLSQEEFKHWSYQTINQTMLARLKAIYNQSHLAQLLGNTYITESAFESKILSFSKTENSEMISCAINFLSLKDSLFKVDSPKTIIHLREKYPAAFERFNTSILSVADELQGVEPGEFQRRSQKLLDTEILPQIDECRSTINQLQLGLTGGVLTSLGGIALAINTESMLPFIPALLSTTATALTAALPALGSYQSQKSKPSYIWHRLSK